MGVARKLLQADGSVCGSIVVCVCVCVLVSGEVVYSLYGWSLLELLQVQVEWEGGRGHTHTHSGGWRR